MVISINTVPKTARDGDKFHRNAITQFETMCAQRYASNWIYMDGEQQLHTLEAFMMMKFSITKPTGDDRGWRMVPLPCERWCRAEISWGSEFYMHMHEMKDIANEVMKAYEHGASFLYHGMRDEIQTIFSDEVSPVSIS